jgi:hypothetical protein
MFALVEGTYATMNISCLLFEENICNDNASVEMDACGHLVDLESLLDFA